MDAQRIIFEAARTALAHAEFYASPSGYLDLDVARVFVSVAREILLHADLPAWQFNGQGRDLLHRWARIEARVGRAPESLASLVENRRRELELAALYKIADLDTERAMSQMTTRRSA